MTQSEQKHPIQPESVKVVYETAVREYDGEGSRINQLDGKITPMIAATGAVLLFVAGFVAKPSPELPLFWRGVYFTGVCLTIFTLAGAQFSLLMAMWIRPFSRMKLADLTDRTGTGMVCDVNELRIMLAEKYCSLLTENTAVTERKVKWHKRGLVILNIALLMLIVLLAVNGAVAGATP